MPARRFRSWASRAPRRSPPATATPARSSTTAPCVCCWGRGGEIGARSSSMTAVEVAGLSGVRRASWRSAPATFGGSVAPFTCAVRDGRQRLVLGLERLRQLATGTTDNLPSSTAPLATLITSGAQRLAAGGAHARLRAARRRRGAMLGNDLWTSSVTPPRATAPPPSPSRASRARATSRSGATPPAASSPTAPRAASAPTAPGSWAEARPRRAGCARS